MMGKAYSSTKFSLIALALTLPPIASAAVGDVVAIDSKNPYFIEGIVDTTPDMENITSVDKIHSTRFYDSNKGGPWTNKYSDGTVGDHNMCWSHTATNAIQYWQDVYGVFYTDKGYMKTTNSTQPRSLNNGFYSTTMVTDYDTIINGAYAKVEVGNAMELNIARAFYNDWGDASGKFTDGVDWYFRGGNTDKSKNYSGGYYSEYFGNSDAYVATSISNDMVGLKNALTDALGLKPQGNNQYVQNEEGLLAGISIAYETAKGDTYGHAINCVGVTFDSNGDLDSLIITNGDMGLNGKPGIAEIQNVYVQSDPDDKGKIKLYTNKECTDLWIAGREYYIREVAYINTPEVLQNMLSEYRDTSEAAVWNGSAGEWSTQVDVVDSEIADEFTGWDIYVDGSTGRNITEEHHGYYHGYALEGRDVLFSDHAAADKRRVSVTGAVKAQNIEVTAEGYSFTKGTNGSISSVSGGGSLNIRSGGSLSSEVSLNGRNVQLEDNALLELTYATSIELGDLTMQGSARLTTVENATVKVTGNFTAAPNTAPQAATFTMRSSPQALAPSIEANLDLTEADSITLATSVNMNGYDLILSDKKPITLELAIGSSEIPFFTNIGTLYINEEEIAEGTNLATVLTFESAQNLAGYSIIYDGSNISLAIPEPTSATLSILALAALATRRRRK